MTTADYLTQLQQDREDLVDNLETMGITGLTGDETFTELVPEVLNIPSGGGSDYFKSLENGTPSSSGILKSIKTIPSDLTVNGQNLSYCFSSCSGLTSFPSIDTSNVTNMQSMFSNCSNLITVSLFDTSNVTNMAEMFFGCYHLANLPQLNTSKVTNMQSMFSAIEDLTNESLNNILAMCVGATAYNGTKTLKYLFTYDMSDIYPSATIQSLSNYQDFINAGWTIGWS